MPSQAFREIIERHRDTLAHEDKTTPQHSLAAAAMSTAGLPCPSCRGCSSACSAAHPDADRPHRFQVYFSLDRSRAVIPRVTFASSRLPPSRLDQAQTPVTWVGIPILCAVAARRRSLTELFLSESPASLGLLSKDKRQHSAKRIWAARSHRDVVAWAMAQAPPAFRAPDVIERNAR